MNKMSHKLVPKKRKRKLIGILLLALILIGCIAPPASQAGVDYTEGSAASETSALDSSLAESSLDPLLQEPDGDSSEPESPEDTEPSSEESELDADEDIPEPDFKETPYTYENEDITVKVFLANPDDLPQGAELSVVPITSQEQEERYRALVDAITEQAIDENQVIGDLLLYDISFWMDGEEIEPLNPAEVSIQYKETAFTQQAVEMASDLKVLHMTEQEDSVVVEDMTDTLYAEDVDQGISHLTFQADSFSPYAILLADEVKTGSFFYQVDAITDITANYLIVSANGSHALTYGSVGVNQSPKASMTPVKGNAGYYTTDLEITNDMLMQFGSTVSTNATMTIKTVGGKYIDPNADTLFTTSRPSLYVIRTKADVWRIAVSSSATAYSITDRGHGFVKSNNPDGSNGLNAFFASFQHMVIYQQVDTTLTIPGDVADTPIIKPEDEPPTDPNAPYPDYLPVSPSDTGEYTVGERDIQYDSDPATAQIENLFSGVKDDDGKVLTDKSVVYMKDDYQGIGTYAEGEFGVTLSALSQESRLKDAGAQEVPMDVVLILDNSASMLEEINGEKRAKTMIDALNNTIHKIMQMNSANRVGVVYFNDVSGDGLELGRYYVGSASTTPDYDGPVYEYVLFNGTTIKSNPNLKYADTKQTAAGPEITLKSGTYTQQGIQRAANMFLRQETTHVRIGDQDIPRTPVTILLSDGMPTYVTSHYTNPIAGPHYGSGNSSAKPYDGDVNNKGVMGYYTILSANYFKKAIGIHYNRTSKFFTIGIGIYAEDEADVYEEMGNTGIGDHYSRAILDPSEEHLQTLIDRPDPPENGAFGPQLYHLLKGTYSGKPIFVRSTGDTYQTNTESSSPLGITNVSVPLLSNPYDNYDYADHSYFGAKFNTSELTAIFSQILVDSAETAAVFSRSLAAGSELTVTDELGGGMEVKGEPVIRYAGTNYSLVPDGTEQNPDGSTTRKYRAETNVTVTNSAGEDVSLANSLISITTGGNNRQTVQWDIPDTLLPAYRQSYYHDYYYEMLPIRLIYRVGLRGDVLANLPDSATYYTNEWRDGTSAKAIFTPHEDNPYYKTDEHIGTEIGKSENTTGTSETYFTIERTGTGQIKNSMGNNGKLELKNSLIRLEAEKVWLYPDGSLISNTSSLPTVTVQLYRTPSGGTRVPYGTPITLGNHNSWKNVWENLPADGDYTYEVEELQNSDYIVDYENNGQMQSGKIIIKNTLKYTSVLVNKVWRDFDGNEVVGDGKKGVTVTLYRKLDKPGAVAEIAPVPENPVILDEGNGWAYQWNNLDTAEKGNALYIYYVVEDPVSGYDTTYQVSGEPEISSGQSGNVAGSLGGVTITNRRSQDTGEIIVKKYWQDPYGNELSAADTPEKVKVTLKYRKGYLFDENPPYDYDKIVWWPEEGVEVETVELTAATQWQHTWTDLLKTEKHPNPSVEGIYIYYYYLEEELPDGFAVSYSDNNIVQRDETTGGIQDGEITVTNKKISNLVMPETGGPYLALATVLGVSLMAALPITAYKRLKGKDVPKRKRTTKHRQ